MCSNANDVGLDFKIQRLEQGVSEEGVNTDLRCLKRVFNFALENQYDAVITMDGDGQHDPENLPDFINKFSNTQADIIIGNRMKKTRNMPPARFITNKFMSFIISRLCNQLIPDSQCGFRLINSSVLRSIALSTSNFEIESEVLIAASRKKFRIESVPIKTIYQDEKSKISPLVDTVRFINFIFRQAWTSKLYEKKWSRNN